MGFCKCIVLLSFKVTLFKLRFLYSPVLCMRKKLGGTARRRHEPPEYSFIISQWLLPITNRKKVSCVFTNEEHHT